MSERSRSAERVRKPHGPSPSGPIAMPGEKAKDFKGTLRKLIAYIGRYKWTVLVVWVIAVLSTVFMIAGPKILGEATDELFRGILGTVTATGEGINFAHIGTILLQLVALYVVSALFSYLQGFIMTGVTMKVTYQLRRDIDEKIHRLPLGYYDKTTHGDVLSRITNDVDAISQSLNQSITQIITSITGVIGILIMMLTISWQLTLIELLIIPLSILFITLIVKKSQKYFVGQQKYLGKVNGHVEEMYGGHVLVKAFNGEEQSAEQFETYNEKLYRSNWKSNFLSGLMMPITNFIGNLGYVAVCIAGGYFAANGMMTVGGIQAFIQYIRSFNQPIAQLSQISNVLQQTMAASERVFEFLDETEEVPEKENALSVFRGEEGLAGEGQVCVKNCTVEFDNVTFGYTPEKTIIHNFSAKIQPGQKVAIVGPTGAGKTTIVKLLMRFYDVNAGAIAIDGHDIRDFKRGELRSLFGMVLQDTWLFNGTILDNIRYGKLDADKDEVKRAAKAAQVDHFVNTLPGGYKMVLNEEAGNVSSGQKQLLTIARAILADPDILILDEATSNVDTSTEILIQKALDNLMKGRTSFIIAHRLSTIRNADLILVMKDGDIIEQGSHEELLAKGGFYKNLYNSQFDRAS